jgi:predicted membrane protein
MIRLVLGVLFLLDNLEVASFGHVVRIYWPLILVFLGIAFLLRRQRVAPRVEEPKSSGGTHEGTESPADTISETSVFGKTYVRATSKNFKGGSVSTVFGNVEINLASAELAMGEQHLGVHGVFGGVRITLPKDVGVMVRGNCMFGDIIVLNQKRGGIGSEVLYKSENYDSAERKLNITASQVFGGVRIW